MSRLLLVLLLGEARLQLRQPLALGLLLLFPLLVGPGWLLGLDGMKGSMEGASEGTTAASEPASDRVRLAMRVAGPPRFAGWVEADDALEVATAGALASEGPLGDVLAEVVLDGEQATVRYRPDQPRSRAARQRIRQVLERERQRRLEERLDRAGVEVRPDELIVVSRQDLSTAAERAGNPLGGMLPPMLLLVLSVAGLYTAVDVVTGERERGTVETLLTTGADRRAILLAKLLMVVAATVASGWLALLSVQLVAGLGWMALPTLIGGSATLGPHLPLLALATGLLALQVSGATLILASWVPDYKAASMVGGPLLLLLLVPGAAGMLPVQLGPVLAVTPIAGVSLAVRDQLSGDLGLPTLLAVLAASLVHGALALGAAWRLFGREAALFGHDDGRARRRLGWYGRDAAALFTLAVLLLWFFGQTAQALDLVWGMVFTQVVLLGGVAVGGVAWVGLPLRETLSLTRPRLRDLALAVLAGLCAPAVGSLVHVLQDPWLPTSQRVLDEMARLTLADQPLWVPLLVFAVLPGLFEELLFRGALLGLLRRSLGPVARVLVVAAAFGALHLAVTRFLPTAALGVLLTVAALRSGSIWPAVIVHGLNNGLIVTLSRAGMTDTGEDGGAGAVALLVLGATLSVGAVAAMGREPPGPAPRSD